MADDRNHALDGLRGLAALAVALGHSNLTVTGLGVWGATLSTLPDLGPGQLAARLAYLVFPSDAAVTLFFVLSGHVLWDSFSKRYPRSLLAFPEYLSSRLYRLLPTAIACAIPLGLIAGSWGPARSADALARTMLILSIDSNGVLWSLQVEMVLSLLLFFVWLAVRETLALHLLVLAASVAAFWLDRSIYTLFAPAFLAGALISRLPASWRRRRWLVGSGVPLLVASSLVVGHDWPSRYGEMLGAFLIVAYVGERQPGLLVNRPVHFLGRISYPLYLCHIVGLQMTAPLVARYAGGHNWLGILIFAIGSLAITIPLAWLVHVAVELPAMRGRRRVPVEGWRDRLFRRPLGRRSVDPQAARAVPLLD